jgi:hypothetical protein
LHHAGGVGVQRGIGEGLLKLGMLGREPGDSLEHQTLPSARTLKNRVRAEPRWLLAA